MWGNIAPKHAMRSIAGEANKTRPKGRRQLQRFQTGRLVPSRRRGAETGNKGRTSKQLRGGHDRQVCQVVEVGKKELNVRTGRGDRHHLDSRVADLTPQKNLDSTIRGHGVSRR